MEVLHVVVAAVMAAAGLSLLIWSLAKVGVARALDASNDLTGWLLLCFLSLSLS